MEYLKSTAAERGQQLADRILANERTRFDANGLRKQVRVRQGITTAQRQALVASQVAIMTACHEHKVVLMAAAGVAYDSSRWSYSPNVLIDGVTYPLMNAAARDERERQAIAAIELKHRSLTLDRAKLIGATDPLLDQPDPRQPTKTRRAVLVEQVDTLIASADAEHAERVADTSSAAAAPR